MAETEHRFTYSEDAFFIKVFEYWYNNIKEDYMLDQMSSNWFQVWLKAKYNIDWESTGEVHILLSYSNEDWIRFQLEWM